MGSERGDTRERILHAAYELFYRKGFSRISMDAVAEHAGVTKRTIYYHFPSKDDVVAEVMEVQHLHLLREFQSWAGGAKEGPAEIVENLFVKLHAWAERPGWLGSGFTRLTIELADLPGHPARRAARRHKAAVELWLEKRLGEDLSRQVMVLIEGGMSLALIHGDPGYIQTAAEAARQLVERAKENRARERGSGKR